MGNKHVNYENKKEYGFQHTQYNILFVLQC